METRVLIQSAPKPYAAFLITPMMLYLQFDQDWPTGFRDIQVQMCEIFHTQWQVTTKWVVWFGPKSNSTELLCLSWLPATLMMIRSKMNELAWRHHFPIIGYGNSFRRSRAANYVVSGPIWPKFELLRDFIHIPVTCKYKKYWIKSNREKGGDTIFPIISQWELSVAMDTRVLIQSISKHYAAFRHPQWCYT